MPSWGSYSFLFGPLVAFAVVMLLMVVLKWTYGRNRSVVASRPRPGRPEDYGLLVPVAAPATLIEAEVMRRRLEAGGLRATVADTLDGPRVMVLETERERAERMLG